MSQVIAWAWHKLDRHYLETIGEIWSESILQIKLYARETVEHLIILCVIYILLCIVLYTGISKWKRLQFRSDVKNAKNVLIVIAHPDDECMFFGPTILNFTKNKNVKIYLMCLSTGRNYGMGSIRKNELYNSCKMLGIDESCILVHSHTSMPDEMGVKWPTELVAKLISNHVESLNINTLITFDRHGVSQHTNHCSIYYAIAHLSLEKILPSNCTVYVLETVNLIRKYWLFLDFPLSFLLSRTRFVVDLDDRSLIHLAMRQHQSQLVWFRRVYMLFSRYMLVNTLQKMDLSDIELDLEVND